MNVPFFDPRSKNPLVPGKIVWLFKVSCFCSSSKWFNVLHSGIVLRLETRPSPPGILRLNKSPNVAQGFIALGLEMSPKPIIDNCLSEVSGNGVHHDCNNYKNNCIWITLSHLIRKLRFKYLMKCYIAKKGRIIKFISSPLTPKLFCFPLYFDSFDTTSLNWTYLSKLFWRERYILIIFVFKNPINPCLQALY